MTSFVIGRQWVGLDGMDRMDGMDRTGGMGWVGMGWGGMGWDGKHLHNKWLNSANTQRLYRQNKTKQYTDEL